MGLAGDERVTDGRTQSEPRAALREGVTRGRAARRDPFYEGATRLRLGSGAAEVIAFPRRRESLAAKLERERRERERADRERRARIERERAARERAQKERWERRRREREEWLRRERERANVLRRERAGAESLGREREVHHRRPQPAAPTHEGRTASTPPPAQKRGVSSTAPPTAPPAQVRPRVQGPVRKRARAAENRTRAAARRAGLFWPTAKAGFAVTVVLGLGAMLGYLVGLPVPGLDAGSGRQSLASSASVLGLDPGTPPGLVDGYVFPVLGPHEFGDAQARFGASRYGHVHEGQDIFAKTGTPEVAVHDGVVVDRGTDGGRYSGGRGNYVVIYDPAHDRSFVYMHLLKPSAVQIGDPVHAGQVIGQLGCSGSCWGPHLHFEVRIGKATLHSQTRAVDPLPFLRQWPHPTVR
jgi:murein DD-endopeptidase MepM/ murein hydrolase activator NlpD